MNVNDINIIIVENIEDIVFNFHVRWNNNNNVKLKIDTSIYYYIFDKEKCEIYFKVSSGINNWNFAVLNLRCSSKFYFFLILI